jgi:DNA repair exonuclease SbcCD ATPase subunit
MKSTKNFDVKIGLLCVALMWSAATITNLRAQNANIQAFGGQTSDQQEKLSQMRMEMQDRMNDQQLRLADQKSRMSDQQEKLSQMRMKMQDRMSDQQLRSADQKSRMNDQQGKLSQMSSRIDEQRRGTWDKFQQNQKAIPSWKDKLDHVAPSKVLDNVRELNTIRDSQTRNAPDQLNTVRGFLARSGNQDRAIVPMQQKEAHWVRSLANPRDQHTEIQAMKDLEDYRYNVTKNLAKPMGITGPAGTVLSTANSGFHEVREMELKKQMDSIKDQKYEKQFDYRNSATGVTGHSSVTVEKRYEPGDFKSYMGGNTVDTITTRESYHIQTPTYSPSSVPTYQPQSYSPPMRTYTPMPSYHR